MMMKIVMMILHVYKDFLEHLFSQKYWAPTHKKSLDFAIESTDKAGQWKEE